MNKSIDLSQLPTKNNKIDWQNSIGSKAKFEFLDVKDILTITDYKNNYITVKCKDIEVSMRLDHFKDCRFAKLVGNLTIDFRYKKGDILKDSKRNITITEAYNEKNSSSNWNQRYYKYTCGNCGAENQSMSESNLERGNGCVVCHGLKVVKGINDLASTDPWMILYFQEKDKHAIYELTHRSTKLFNFICPDCGKIKEKQLTVDTLYNSKGISCVCKKKPKKEKVINWKNV